MAYSDINEYIKRHGEMSAEEAERLLETAEEQVDHITGFAISRRGFEGFCDAEKALIRKAVFAQADKLSEGSGIESDTGGEPVSVTIGSFSYSYGSAQAATGAAEDSGGFSKLALGYLEAAGLLLRRIGVI